MSTTCWPRNARRKADLDRPYHNKTLRFAQVRAVLFDLDGTLADTAPDLAAAANTLRKSRGLGPLPLAVLRPVASHGARGLIRVALGVKPEQDIYETLRLEFLAHYESRLCVDSRLFDGVPEMLESLAAKGIPWGIVTNKARRFTDPLVPLLGFASPAAVVVSGDTTPHAKPHPAPLLHAAKEMGFDPAACAYVGDDLRDIQAGQAAGMATVAAAYGYCADSHPRKWKADAVIGEPMGLMGLLGDAVPP